MSVLYETVVARLGARFALGFCPQRQCVRHSALGWQMDEELDLALGLRVGNEVRALPFTKRYAHFDRVEQDITPTSLRYLAESFTTDCEVTASFTAPFYPQDEAVSGAPFFYVDITIKRGRVSGGGSPGPEVLEGKLLFELERPKTTLDLSNGSLHLRYSVIPTQWDLVGTVPPGENPLAHIDCEEELRPVGETAKEPVNFRLRHGEEARFSFVWAAHIAGPALLVKDEYLHFKYTRRFHSVAEVADYAITEREQILRRTQLFNSLFTDSSLGKGKVDFMSHAFQSYLSNTWLMSGEQRKEWFSVWEGSCRFHSTVDVEYNLAWFYLAFWPELLELTLREWRDHERDNAWLEHDMGACLVVQGARYGHPMEVEENTNFILLTYALWRMHGKTDMMRENFPLIQRLTAYLLSTDTTGNGFPDKGTSNTIDDASPAVQNAKEQTYLGVKTLAACLAVKSMAEAEKDRSLAHSCAAMAKRIQQTLDAEAWLGDHYAVCLVAPDQRSREDLRGWDASSLYTTNGLLYLLAAGMEIPLHRDRLREDILTSTPASMTIYGCTHSSTDHSNVWVSQNMWRDFTAAYLGLDLLDMMDRYWAFEIVENSIAGGKGGGFIDTYGWNGLNFYPRGATSFGILFALPGLAVDQVAGKIQINPARLPLKLPLPIFADWEGEQIPWLECSMVKGKMLTTISSDELIEGLVCK